LPIKTQNPSGERAADKNDRGPGTPAKELQFWTMPLHPIIEGSVGEKLRKNAEKTHEKPWNSIIFKDLPGKNIKQVEHVGLL